MSSCGKMAEAMSSKEDIFMCSICLDLLKDPVTLSCGHSYCLDCINNHWNGEDQKRVYSCPQCRQKYTSRPILNKNYIVAELVEEMRKTTCQPDVLAGHGDVQCDVCSVRKLKAVKSCLDCLLSYCEAHFKAHNDLNPGRNHSIINALFPAQLQERICSLHNKPLDIFCRSDQTCVCYLCMADQHKDHDTIAATTEWSNEKERLEHIQTRCQQKIQKKEEEVQELRRAVDTLKDSAQSAEEHSDMMFDLFIHYAGIWRFVVTKMIRDHEEAEVSWAEGLLERLEQEISEMKKTVAEMEQLSQTQDHINFLKNIGSISDIPYSTSPSRTFGYANLSFEPVKTSVSALRTQLQEKFDLIFKQEANNIAAAVATVQIQSEYTDPHREADRSPWWLSILIWALPWIRGTTLPETREDLLQYYCHFTLDPNTAFGYFHLSERNRMVEMTAVDQLYHYHPERFDEWWQVMCREGVSGRCYWEVEWSGEPWVNIAVSYKTISRKGRFRDCWFGHRNKSWRLALYPGQTLFGHNDEEIKLPLVASSRVGVYVDHRAGILAFYSISDTTMTLLHKVQTTFSQTLYLGFALVHGAVVKLL